MANALADGQCNLTDGSSRSDWRLPTEAEWRATTAKAVVLGCGAATSDGAFFGDLVHDGAFGSDKVVTLLVWRVRGGPR